MTDVDISRYVQDGAYKKLIDVYSKLSCKISDSETISSSGDGDKINIFTSLWFDNKPDVRLNDVIIFNNNEYVVVEVKYRQDFDNEYLKVKVKWHRLSQST